MKKTNILKLEDVKDGITKVSNNAALLIEDAEILFNSKKYPRTFTLAHLSIEEMAKLSILFRVGTLLQINGEINWEKFWNSFKNHNKKLVNNMFWFLMMSEYIDIKKIDSIIEDNMKVIEEKNYLKNKSLYVSFIDNKFVEPFESISRQRAQITLELSKKTYEIVKQTIPVIFATLSKNEENIMNQFRDMKDFTKSDFVEFLNNFEDIIKVNY